MIDMDCIKNLYEVYVASYWRLTTIFFLKTVQPSKIAAT